MVFQMDRVQGQNFCRGWLLAQTTIGLRVTYWGYIGIMEKKMETTIAFRATKERSSA